MRVRVLAALFAILIATCSVAAAEAPASAKQGSSKSKSKSLAAASISGSDIAYGSDPAQKFDAYVDEAKTGAPWVMVVHGGSWMGGDKADYTQPAINAFYGAGFQVFSINYRLSPTAQWPAQRDDTNDALDYVRAHAEEFHIDKDRGVLYGASAGGQIATSVGVKGGAAKVRAVIGVSSVLQPLRVWQYAHGIGLPGGVPEVAPQNLAGWEAVLFRCPPVESFTYCYGRWRDGTPQNYVSSDDPPMLFVHSADDAASPIEGDTSFINALNAAGGSGALITAGGDVHDDGEMLWGNTNRTGWVLNFAIVHTR